MEKTPVSKVRVCLGERGDDQDPELRSASTYSTITAEESAD